MSLRTVPPCLWLSALLLLTGGCANDYQYYEPPATGEPRAVIFHEWDVTISFETKVYLHVLEVDRLRTVYLPEYAWEDLPKPERLAAGDYRALPVAPGERKLLLHVCRNNWIPFCDYKCAAQVARLQATAGGLYEVKVRVGDDHTKFRIVDAVSQEVLVGPLQAESSCETSSFPDL